MDAATEAPPRPADFLTFREYCERALYDPRDGFYSKRRPAEHFYTAPELHPAFGWTLARALAPRLRELGDAEPLSVVEAGAGEGLLSARLREGLEREFPELARALRWVLVERSPRALARALAAVPGAAGASDIGEVEPFCGVLLSNELIDALPFHVLEKQGGAVHELYADGSGRTRLGKLSDARLGPAAAAVSDALPEGGRHGVCLEAPRWLDRAAGKLVRGWIITVDYGKMLSASDPNAPRSYRRHVCDGRIAEAPGLRDLTLPADFSALCAAGARLGLRRESFSSMGGFLLDHGLLDFMPREDTPAALAERAKLKTLLHPEGMGEAFKVMVQSQGVAK